MAGFGLDAVQVDVDALIETGLGAGPLSHQHVLEEGGERDQHALVTRDHAVLEHKVKLTERKYHEKVKVHALHIQAS